MIEWLSLLEVYFVTDLTWVRNITEAVESFIVIQVIWTTE